MATPGQLDIAGILYEGNWAEWYPRMTAVLEYNGLGHCLQLSDKKLPWQHEGALRLVKRMVSKSLLARTAQPDCTLPKLLGVLEKAAQPFRLLNLAPELRNRVYILALPQRVTFEWGDCMNPLIHYPTRFERPALPPITRVFSQLRKEAISLYYSETVFAFDAFHLESDENMSMVLLPWV